MAAELMNDIESPESAKPAKKRVREPRLRRSAAWSQTVARMTETTKLPDGEKG